jgi:hypothetical protein
MTQSQRPPIDPDTVAEIAPGEGPEPGSVEYGGSEIHQEGAGSGAPASGSGEAVTTEAGTFQDLPVDEDDRGE